MTRRKTYANGISTLQAIVRALWMDRFPNITSTSIQSWLAISFLLTCQDDDTVVDGNNVDLQNLRLLNLNFSSSGFDNELVASLPPGVPLSEYAFNGLGPREILAMGSQVLAEDVLLSIILTFASLEFNGRMGETSDGYIGLFPIKTEPDDLVCILKDCDTAIILRKRHEGYYAFVETAFIVGLINGEAKGFIGDGKATTRWFELR